MTGKKGSKIGALMVIAGDIRCESQVVVEGRISGTFSGKNLIIGEKAHIKGRVSCDVIECSGRIEGDILTSSFILKSSACHIGTVETAELTVNPGATLDCALQSGASKRPRRQAKVAKKDMVLPGQEVLNALLSSLRNEVRPCSMEIPHSNRQRSYTGLLGLLEKGKPLVTVTGEKGSGKSTLIEKLKTNPPAGVEPLVLTDQIGSVAALLERLCSELNIDGCSALDQGELLAQINQTLAEKRSQGWRVVLLIDDAQNMYPATMEGLINSLTSAFGETEKLLQMILFGTADIRVQMVATTLKYFEDETNCQLDLLPLSIQEVGGYLNAFTCQTAGDTMASSAALFPVETIKKIHAISGGNMGEINRVTERGLLAAIEAGADTVAPGYL